MKKIFFVLLAGILGMQAGAQVTKVSLQASGLTCSMCSKAVLIALEKVSSVEKIQVDIKSQQYHITFKQNAEVDFDALVKSVEDAGFSVAGFKVMATVNSQTLQKDEHIKIGNQFFHFLNAGGQQINGMTTFTVVDKSYTSDRNYKKFSLLSKKECVQTGRAAGCCTKDNIPQQARIYHAII